MLKVDEVMGFLYLCLNREKESNSNWLLNCVKKIVGPNWGKAARDEEAPGRVSWLSALALEKDGPVLEALSGSGLGQWNVSDPVPRSW